ncbi:MAG: hypothetical protein M1358_06025 [Chloroflexi bacterium]|nr:hypothetical protein [Chloroflexota bacterium]
MSFGLTRAFPLGRKRIEPRSLSLSVVFGSALLLATFMSLLYLNQASTVATTGYDIKKLEEDKARWEMRNEQLRLTLEQLRSLDRVEREASSRLKMGPPTKVLFLNPDVASREGPSAPSGAQPSLQHDSESGGTWWEGLLGLFR